MTPLQAGGEGGGNASGGHSPPMEREVVRPNDATPA